MQTIIELPTYLKNAKDLKVSSTILNKIKVELGANPSLGSLIQGTGGLRKIRFADDNTGKSGSYRVITFFHSKSFPVYLLSIYKKNSKDNLTEIEKAEMKKLTTLLIEKFEG